MNKRYMKGKWLLMLLICIAILYPIHTQAAKTAINKKNVIVLKSKTVQLKVKGTSKKVSWITSNKNVARVSDKGKVTAKNPGTANITAKIGKKKYQCKVTVPDKKLKRCKDTKETVTAVGLKGKITWKSSNKKVVSISKKGKIKTKKAGKVLLTAKAGAKTYRIYLSVLNKKHSWRKLSEKKATCTEEGTIKYRCKYCKDIYEDKQDALGHIYTKKVIAPTCDSEGYTIYTCKRNSKHTLVKDFVKETGHKYGTWKVEKKPTCITTGWETTVCSVCKDEVGRDIPMLQHEYVNGICKYCKATEKHSTADKMDVQVTKDKINIHIDGVGKYSDGTLSLIRVAPNEYAEGDKISGISKDTDVLGTELAVYACQTDTMISIDRYDVKGNDRLYSKYYIVSKKGVVKGPIYPSEITPERKIKKFTANTKKGLFGDDSEDMVTETGSKYTVINLNLPNLLVAGKDKNGKLTNAEKEGTYEWTSQGQNYYFNKGYVESFDRRIRSYTDKGIGVSLVICASRVNGWKDYYPASLLYEGGCDKGSIAGINTSSREGVENWIAAIEFLAERYSREDGKYGHINNVVLGNEIDYAYDYNNISDKATSLDVYMEEYSRLLRLTHMAISKYMDTVTVTVPTTHDWMRAEYYNTYKPKEIYDWLNKKSKEEGDFNWGLSPHCYFYSLAGSYCLEDDSINGRKVHSISDNMNTSTHLTFSNLEILEQYLEQDSMKCNGEMRDVYLTESGCSSYLGTEGDLRRQAAYVAFAYYKTSILDCIDAIIYYRAVDHDIETQAGATFGLKDNKGKNKYSYDVWKYIDTQYSFRVANEYLDAAAYYDKGIVNVPGKNSNYMDSKETVKYHHTVANGKIRSYKDLMYAFSENYDWDSIWNDKNIIRQTVEPVQELEDKVNLNGIKFYGKSFLADGKEHELLISGQLPKGISVQYENNKRTEKGVQEATANFYKNGELVGTRTAKLQIGDMTTNRSVYEAGEKIYITANAVNNSQWVGIYKKGDIVGDVSEGGIPSVYWYYVNDGNQVSGNTYALQEVGQYNANRPELKDLPAGKYEIILMGKNGTYSKDEVVEITILDTGKKSGLPRLDNIVYKDTVKEYTGEEQSLEISGVLPQNVTVTYTNNKVTEAKKVQATVHFFYYGQELETRTATLSLEGAVEKTLTTDKDTYNYGDDIMVTAVGNKNDWVALYKKDDVIGSTKDGGIESIYWYYVCIDSISGQAFNIRNGKGNSSRTDWSEVKDLPAGEYKVLLLEDGGYNVLQQKNITIKGDAPVVNEKNISTDKDIYVEGEDIWVTAIGDKADWVDIYKEDDKVDAISDGGIPSIYWYTVNEGAYKSGEAVSLRETHKATERPDWDDVKNLPAGNYKVVLLEDGGYNVLKQKNIKIISKEEQEKTKLHINKKEYLMGEDIKVTAVGEGKNVWVGLYKKNDPTDGSVTSIYWYMVNDATHQSGYTYSLKDMTNDNCDHGTRVAYKYLIPGEYKWVLTPEDGSYNVAEEVDFVIKPNEEIENKINLVDPSATYSVNSEIRVATKAYTNTGKDWIAIFKEDVDYTVREASYDSWSHITTNAGITTIKAPSVPGKYKLVYFGEGARHIITTRDITVTIP